MFKFETGSKKYICPNCGKKTWRAYIGLSHEYGKCDRINSCGYFNPPGINVSEDRFKPPCSSVIVDSVAYPSQTLYDGVLNDFSSHLHMYLRSKLKMDDNHFRKWMMGTKEDHTAFGMFNGKLYNISFIPYNTDGHRNKARNKFSLSTKVNGVKYGRCLYGIHLLRKDHPCFIVESEKTAVIASWVFPEYDFLASGSSNGLSDGSNGSSDVISSLCGIKDIYWLCDADKAGRYNSSIRNMITHNIKHKVVDLFPDRNDGWDIGDEILFYGRKRSLFCGCSLPMSGMQ